MAWVVPIVGIWTIITPCDPWRRRAHRDSRDNRQQPRHRRGGSGRRAGGEVCRQDVPALTTTPWPGRTARARFRPGLLRRHPRRCDMRILYRRQWRLRRLNRSRRRSDPHLAAIVMACAGRAWQRVARACTRFACGSAQRPGLRSTSHHRPARPWSAAAETAIAAGQHLERPGGKTTPVSPAASIPPDSPSPCTRPPSWCELQFHHVPRWCKSSFTPQGQSQGAADTGHASTGRSEGSADEQGPAAGEFLSVDELLGLHRTP